MTDKEKDELKDYIMWLDLQYSSQSLNTEGLTILLTLNTDYPKFKEPVYRRTLAGKIFEIINKEN